MLTLRELQNQFGRYLTTGTSTITELVDDADILDRENRLQVYRHAYILRLKECIDKDHDILGRYLGDDLFDRLCEQYIAKHPSEYTSLRYFCDRLPSFLETQPPFKEIPVLAEIASFERLLMFAFDAADSAQSQIEDLHNIGVSEWPQIRVNFHPSIRHLVAHWNSVEIWQALKQKKSPPTAIRHEQPTYWLIWRGTDRLTQFRSITHDAFELYFSLQNRATLAKSCEKLLTVMPESNIGPCVATHLENWITAGLISAIGPR